MGDRDGRIVCVLGRSRWQKTDSLLRIYLMIEVQDLEDPSTSYRYLHSWSSINKCPAWHTAHSCTCTCMYMYIHMFVMPVHVCCFTCIHVYIRMCTCMHMYVYMHAHVCVHVCTCMYMYMFAPVCVTYMHENVVYMHIHGQIITGHNSAHNN